VSGRDVQPTLEQALGSCWVFQAAGSFVSRLALAPGPGPGSASSSLRGASSWRPGQPVAARGSSRRANWRWSRPPRPAHRARMPGRPVHAMFGHATSSCPTSLRALKCVPSSAGVRAYLPQPRPPALSVSVFMLKTDSNSLLDIIFGCGFAALGSLWTYKPCCHYVILTHRYPVMRSETWRIP
jgi:hypothetical protein